MKDILIPNRPELINRLIPRYDITPEPTDDQIAQSYLGTPVYSNLEFLKVSGTSRDNSIDVNGQDNGAEVMLRVDTVIIEVMQTKNIVITPIQGQVTGGQNENGKLKIFSTVKEYISGGDYMINISGMIVSQYPNVFPHEEVVLLQELLNLPKAIPVASKFFDLFSISNIVVESFTVAEKMGSRNEVPFQIQALSDEPIEFTLNA